MTSRVMRLLIVDDAAEWRYSLALQFDNRADVVISEAASGEEAVEKIKNEDYDLVLLDMKMPSDTEGLDALKNIKAIKPSTQVIMMSAYGDIPKAVQAIRYGALDFLPKGVDFDDIVKYKTDDFIRTTHLIADRELLIRTKYNEAKRLKDIHKKGKALEELLASLLESIDNFIVIGRDLNTATEEIDIVLRNVGRNPLWRNEGEIILVECKNWRSQRVGKNEFGSFERKIENRYGRCKLGFLVCIDKFAETLEKEKLRSSRGDILIVPIDGVALYDLVMSSEREQLLRSLVDKAILT